MLEISPRWPESVCRHRPLEVSHTLVEWSKEPVMIRLPSVLKLSETISAVCPSSEHSSTPLYLPSVSATSPLYLPYISHPSSEHSSTPLCTSHSLAVESIEPVATTWGRVRARARDRVRAAVTLTLARALPLPYPYPYPYP